MAAGQAAAQGAAVTVLERMPHPGTKLGIAGKGRGNLTNTQDLENFLKHFNPAGGKFLRQAFHAFFADDLIAFLEAEGVPCRREPDGRVFPASDSARDVVDALTRFAVRHGARLVTATRAERLVLREKSVAAVVTRHAADAPRELPADAVILAAGGLSYPQTGSTGDGYRLAEAAGLRIVPLRPALVPIETAGSVAARLQGTSLRDVALQVRANGKKLCQDAGDLLFTHFGMSGPVVLRRSVDIVDALAAGSTVELVVDLCPGEETKALEDRLIQAFAQHGKQSLRRLLDPMLTDKMIPVVSEQAELDPARKGNQITAEERRRLIRVLKEFVLQVTGHRPMAEAMVTAGGVDTREVDPRTMGSRVAKGLYLAGEVLDINGDTGGFNLQAAFSTGWLAGRSAADAVLHPGRS
jgi:hypothetical protein